MSYITKKYKCKYKLFVTNSASEPKTLLKKFKNIPNISKLHHLTNESMKSLIKKSDITNYEFSPITTTYSNSNKTRKRINFFLPPNYMIPFQKNNEVNKKNIWASQSKLILDKYFLNEQNINKNFSTTENKHEFSHKNKNRVSFCSFKNLALNPRRNKKNNTRKLIQDIQKGLIKRDSNLLEGRKLRRSSQIDKLLFQYLNPNECFEDYVVDCKPSDKYKFFKKQLEKKKTAIEANLIKLKLPLE